MKKGLLNAFHLKLIMAALMLLDHIWYYLPDQPFWFHQAARVVAPVFTFLVAEGMAHTRNPIAYIRRILLFGVAMLAGNMLLEFIFGGTIENSILISLAITAALLYCVDRMREGPRGPLWLVAAILLLLLSLNFEGAWLCPLMGLVFYLFRDNRLKMCAAYVIAMTAMHFLTGFPQGVQMLMLLAVIPILLYNGERGPENVFSRYFFYCFYPIHIWILFIISNY